MGIGQSVTITQPQADDNVKPVKKDEANGHAMPGLDLTDAVTSKASVQQNTKPPVTVTGKPTPASVEANGIQVKAPTVSVETSGIQLNGVTVSAESSTPAKDTPKQAGTPNVFNKMFKKKSGHLSPEPEANVSAELQTDSQIPKPTPASVDVNGIQVKAPTVSVETSGIQVSGVTVSAESSTAAKDTPKQAGTPNVFNKRLMFKKKSRLLSLEPEANVSAEVEIAPKSTPASVDINGIQVKAPTVSVETSGIKVSGVTVSAESSTAAKDTPKQAGTPNVFNKMFKKKSELVLPEPEANVSAELQTDNQIPKSTPASVDVNGIQVKAPTVSVETSGIKVSGVTVSAESSTPAKDTPKQAGTPNVFNKMFKKKSELVLPEPEANVSAEVAIAPNPTPASVDINGIQVKAPTVSVETSGIQLNGVTVSAESSTPAKDTPKQAGTPNMFNKMFKKKSGLLSLEPEANVSAELQTDSQIPKPTPASVDVNGIQVKAPTVSVETSGIQLNGVTVSAESSTPAKDTPKQAGTPNVFNKMFKKKSGLLSLEPEANVSAELQTDSQIPNPTPASVDINGIQVKAPTVSVETSGIQLNGVTVSAESSTPAKDTPKQAGTPNMFNKMFKKKSGLLSLEPEANVSAELQTDSQIPKPTPASVDVNGIQVKAPTVSVETPGIQLNGVTVSAESSTPPKDTPKQAGTPNMFNKMFRKKSELVLPEPEANVSAELQTDSQIPKPTPASVDVNGIQVKAPTVSVETSGIQLNGVTVSAESSTPPKDTPKQAGTPNVFNKMFKKKSGLLSLEPEANVSAELQTDSQIPKPTPASVDVNGIQVKAPTVSVETSGIQVSGVTVSAESSTAAKDTPKQAGTPNMFNKMFRKKSELVLPEPEANVSAEVAIAPNPTPASVDIDGIQVKAPTVSVETSGIQLNGVTVSAESSTPAKDTPKQAGTPNVFNKMFKKKSGLLSLEPEANVSAELQTDSQIPKPTPASVDVNGIQVKAPTVSVETPGIQLNGVTVSAESSTPAKDTPKQAGTPNMFNKMFRKKSELVLPEPEANVSAELQTDSQIPKPTPASVDVNGIQVKPPAVSVETSGIQVSGVTVSAESSTPAKDTPKQAGTPNVFNKMFKKKSELVLPEPEANVSAEVAIAPNPTPASIDINGIQVKAPTVSVETSGIQLNGVTVSAESSTAAKDTPKQAGTPNVFNKMFRKKSGLLCFEPESNVAAELAIVPKVQTDNQIPEPTDIKASTQPEKQPQGEDPTEVTQDSTQPEQIDTEENSVMNFFKTLVSSTKTTKEATASPDVSKEQQSHKETPPAPAANLQEASKIPPPPPPAPPKMESKAEPAVKKEEAPAAEAAAGAAKEPETPGKAKTKDSAFGKLFRTKVLLGKKASKGGAKVPAKSAVKEEARPVEIQVDASKTSTLEAGAKPEPPPAPKPEEKKAEKKPSPFANLLKPKVLLGQVSSRIHAAASSVAAGISLGAGGAATESKKGAAAAPTAPAEAGPNTKAKEEPKPAGAPAVASSDNKSVGSTDNSSPSSSRKLEKRNSIHLFFKNLGQKRHSDVEVQTEPVAPEKAK